jgi:hypothetical protein
VAAFFFNPTAPGFHRKTCESWPARDECAVTTDGQTSRLIIDNTSNTSEKPNDGDEINDFSPA